MRVFSIFNSVDGEVNGFHQGRLATFIRFSGCPLCCKYCDTKYAWGKNTGQEMSVDEILAQVKEKTKITITGGEPLTQDPGDLLRLLIHLTFGKQCDVSVETSGAIPFSYIKDLPLSVREAISWVVDFKLPSSGEMAKMAFDFPLLTSRDFVKFVIQDNVDFGVAVEVMKRLQREGCRARFAFSPMHGVFDPTKLISWLWETGLTDAIVNLQLHKYLKLKEDF